MHSDRYDAKGETYVLWENFNRDGNPRPLVRANGGRRRGDKRGNSRSNRSYRGPRGILVKFGGHWLFFPQWFVTVMSVVWDRVKLICITAIISPILVAKVPILIRALLEP